MPFARWQWWQETFSVNGITNAAQPLPLIATWSILQVLMQATTLNAVVVVVAGTAFGSF